MNHGPVSASKPASFQNCYQQIFPCIVIWLHRLGCILGQTGYWQHCLRTGALFATWFLAAHSHQIMCSCL